MRESAERWDAESVSGVNIGRPDATADISGPRAKQTGFGAVCAASAEFDHVSPVGCGHHSSGFACDHRLMIDGREKKRLDHLGFYYRSADC